MFGHPPIEIMYTDNVTDAVFLQECFPSLLEGVTPLGPYSELPLFSLPSSVHPRIAQTHDEIENLMLCLFSDDLGNSTIDMTMDMEWAVSLNEYTGNVRNVGTVDVI